MYCERCRRAGRSNKVDDIAVVDSNGPMDAKVLANARRTPKDGAAGSKGTDNKDPIMEAADMLGVRCLVDHAAQ